MDIFYYMSEGLRSLPPGIEPERNPGQRLPREVNPSYIFIQHAKYDISLKDYLIFIVRFRCLAILFFYHIDTRHVG